MQEFGYLLRCGCSVLSGGIHPFPGEDRGAAVYHDAGEWHGVS